MKYDDISGEIAKPVHLEEMIGAAETLGQDLDFIRADFYDTPGRLYFGELTMTPGCGTGPFVRKSLIAIWAAAGRARDRSEQPRLRHGASGVRRPRKRERRGRGLFCVRREGCVTSQSGGIVSIMSQSAEPVVLVAKEGGIAIVTLNRPSKLNALNRELRTAFCHTMQALRDDGEAKVVIITGAGRGFCAGLDLKELGEDASKESGTVVRDTTNISFVSVIEEYASAGNRGGEWVRDNGRIRAGAGLRHDDCGRVGEFRGYACAGRRDARARGCRRGCHGRSASGRRKRCR